MDTKENITQSHITGITQILVHKEWPHTDNHVLSFTHFPLHVFSNNGSKVFFA